MGINTEMISVMSLLEKEGHLNGKKSVVELGAQVISAHPDSLLAAEKILEGKNRGPAPTNAAELYARYGLKHYLCIDAGGSDTEHKLIADLNRPIKEQKPDIQTFDIVTNLGTSEHCFDQVGVFRNVHDLCEVNGLIIHNLCSQGLVNHGYYNYHPRFAFEMAQANQYQILKMWFTVDFTSELIEYTKDNFELYDDRDIMIYVILKKTRNAPFRLPFDSMFEKDNQLQEYKLPDAVGDKEFGSYIKSTWLNATASNSFRRRPGVRVMRRGQLAGRKAVYFSQDIATRVLRRIKRAIKGQPRRG